MIEVVIITREAHTFNRLSFCCVLIVVHGNHKTTTLQPLYHLEQLECMRSEDTTAVPGLPIFSIHIGSQVKTRQNQSYQFKEFAKNSHFGIVKNKVFIVARPLISIADKEMLRGVVQPLIQPCISKSLFLFVWSIVKYLHTPVWDVCV